MPGLGTIANVIAIVAGGALGVDGQTIARNLIAIVLAMPATMGKGCAFSALPVGLLQGSITLLAIFLTLLATTLALANISMVGAIPIGCVGVNLVFNARANATNILPSIVVAPALSFLPF